MVVSIISEKPVPGWCMMTQLSSLWWTDQSCLPYIQIPTGVHCPWHSRWHLSFPRSDSGGWPGCLLCDELGCVWRFPIEGDVIIPCTERWRFTLHCVRDGGRVLCCTLSSDVPIIGNNGLFNRRSCWLWWSILIFNNRSSDACTKHAITRSICTTRPQGNEVSDTDSLLDDWQ